MEIFRKIGDITDTLKEYIDVRLDSIKLSVAETVSTVIANIMAGLFVVFFLLFFLVFAGIALALIIGEITGHNWMGFLILSGIYFLLAVALWKLRRKFIQLPVMNALIEQFFSDEKNKQS